MSRPSIRASRILTVLFSLLVGPAFVNAQTVYSGISTCGCDTAWFAGMENGQYTAFKLELSDPTVPDVLFDHRPAGGDAIGAVQMTGFTTTTPAGNFTVMELPTDIFVGILTGPGVMLMDSANMGMSVLDAASRQVVGARERELAPRVEWDGDDRVVSWPPIIEINDADIMPDCSLAGRFAQGFIIGYNVYSLKVASFPEPTPRDFFRGGVSSFADLRTLDFSVADPDGMSGSDLDPTDGLTLINPDGIRDSGDEILVWRDLNVDGDTWYTVQPVVQGQQSWFETGLSAGMIPARRVDQDLDGTPESVDIGGDGWIEFIDPSGQGLGLTWGGEILTSPLPGRGVIIEGVPDCVNATTTPATEPYCGNGIDDDGDTLIDCDDDDCDRTSECAEIDCNDGEDDDGDGLVDCLDDDCAMDLNCLVEMDCCDGIDNDGDGLTDLADDDCFAVPGCPESNCIDGMDNDMDGLVDCDDPDCATAPVCGEMECDDGMDNDMDGAIDCDDSDCAMDPACGEMDCGDGVDNDMDGFIDCEDFDCATDPACPEADCDDGVDNDMDGFIDCEDLDCAMDPACGEMDCDDGMDNDMDGFVDCEDLDCMGDPACPETDCDDGLDNDGDGDVDCADADCLAVFECDCADAMDNDADTLVDCDDPDCGCALPLALDIRVNVPTFGMPEVRVSWAEPEPARPYELHVGTLAGLTRDPMTMMVTHDHDRMVCDIDATEVVMALPGDDVYVLVTSRDRPFYGVFLGGGERPTSATPCP
ncbi:MAG: hypothetical protein AAF533_03600 [Acidobacteriota bacterium]